MSAVLNPTGSPSDGPSRSLAAMRSPGAQAVAETKPARPIDVLRKQLASLPEIAQNLPSNVSPEKFRNVVITAANMNPQLLDADRRSLLGACVKCAADGLLPDGRDAALVIFGRHVQYMPMIAGLIRRARNSGQIAGISVQVVYANDEFIWAPDDFEKPVTHRPPRLGEDRGEPIGAYAVVKLTDGTVMHDVMSKAEIEKVRAVSRAKGSGPWVQWWDQMARKTVFRRLAKYLPADAAPASLMARDDEPPVAPNGEVLDGEADTVDLASMPVIQADTEAETET
jgi:recombination protein RecT